MAGANDTEILLKGYPNPRQVEFFCSRARHTAYGGARGGGKSWAMRRKFVLLALRYSNLQLLLLRRTLPELNENHARPLQTELSGFVNYNQTHREFTFPNGSRIKLGYCDNEKDVYQYQGQEYDVIGLEEATHFTESQMQFITTCNRSVRSDFSPRMYYTCNPGGIGHAWVKRLFIDRRYRESEQAEDYVFIPARVTDNPVLMRTPSYLKTLENLPEPLRRAHLNGDWDVLAGQYFGEFSRERHVLEPFNVPKSWRRFRAMDWGYNDPCCVLWFAVSPGGRVYVYREYYEREVLSSETAKRIRSLTGEEKISYTAANSEKRCDFQVLKIANTEYLVAASGGCQMAKWDGVSTTAEAFGSAEGLSNLPVNFSELYYSRLFAAGDADNPGRLYYSQAPGDTRTLENWASAAESENAGGGHVEIGADSDPITGLFALSNQLLIFKRDSLYRLLGDRPGNYRILPVSGSVQLPSHTACARSGDVVYFMTEVGMYYFDGQNVCRKADAEKVAGFLSGVDLSACDAAARRDKLYFAVSEHANSGANDAVLVYDLSRGTYMVRRGFLARGLCASGKTLYIVDGGGYVCRFEEGETYSGSRIDAYWKTPMTDLDSKAVTKRLEELFLRGTGGILSLEAVTEGGTVYNERLMPGSGENILELLLTGDGRAFQLVFRNVNGSHFTIDGGVELLMDVQRRIL